MASFLFVVDKDVSPPGSIAADSTLGGYLTSAGHSVTYQSESDAAPAGGTYDCIVITESGSASSTSKYVDYADGVVCLETSWNTLKISSAGATNAGGTAASLDLNASHPINSGHPDPISLKTSGNTGNYSIATTALASGADWVTMSGDGTRYWCVAADTGAALTSGNAVNRIVCMGLVESNVANMSSDGQAWFVSVCEWAANVSAGTEHTVNATDSTGLTDSATRAWTHKPVFTDVVGLAESIHKQRGHTKTDPVALSDTYGFQYPRSSGDTMGLTDEIIIQLSKGVTITDPVAITDSVAFDYGKGFVDSVSMTDEIHIKHDVHIVVEESVGLSEDVSAAVPSENVYTDNAGLSDSATVQLILNTLKPDSLSIVDDRRLVVQGFFSMSDDEVRVMTIGDLAYKYWSFLSQLTPAERESLYDHFKTYAPDGKHWIEDITEQP